MLLNITSPGYWTITTALLDVRVSILRSGLIGSYSTLIQAIANGSAVHAVISNAPLSSLVSKAMCSREPTTGRFVAW